MGLIEKIALIALTIFMVITVTHFKIVTDVLICLMLLGCLVMSILSVFNLLKHSFECYELKHKTKPNALIKMLCIIGASILLAIPTVMVVLSFTYIWNK